MRMALRLGIVFAAAVAVAAGALVLWPHASTGAYAVQPLASDDAKAPVRDIDLVNGWGLAASATGPWWTTSEARGLSPLYDGTGRKQGLTVRVDGGPTGIVYYGGKGFLVSDRGRTAPARFIYACEDGSIRAWAPSVPEPWSEDTEIAISGADTGAIFRGLALATLPDGSARLYATNFHNDRVEVYDEQWHHLAHAGFEDPEIPAWFGPFGIQAIGDRVFVSYVGRAPVNGNDAPHGGYVDEFDLEGNLVARVGAERLDEPWGMAIAPHDFGRYADDLLVANFGSGRVDAFRRHGDGWRFDGQLEDAAGKPIELPGVWGIAFGQGGMSGPRNRLFFAAGPHIWHGETEQAVHGLFGAVAKVR